MDSIVENNACKMMDKEQYVIEREYLGIISVREFMGMIIKKHDYIEPIEEPVDL